VPGLAFSQEGKRVVLPAEDLFKACRRVPSRTKGVGSPLAGEAGTAGSIGR